MFALISMLLGHWSAISNPMMNVPTWPLSCSSSSHKCHWKCAHSDCKRSMQKERKTHWDPLWSGPEQLSSPSLKPDVPHPYVEALIGDHEVIEQDHVRTLEGRTPKGAKNSTTHVPTSMHTHTSYCLPLPPIAFPCPTIALPYPIPTNVPHNPSCLQATPPSTYTPYHPYPAHSSFYVPQAQPVFSPFGHPSYGAVMTVSDETSAR